MTKDDIPDAVWDEMSISEMGDVNPASHDNNLRETLIDFVLDNNYICGRDDCRGFANEYTCTLQERSSDDKGETTQEEAGEWADAYLYKGDAATTAYVSFRFLEVIHD